MKILNYHTVFQIKTKGKLHAETILGESKGQITRNYLSLDFYEKVSKEKDIDKILEKLFDKRKSKRNLWNIKNLVISKNKRISKLKNGHIIKKVKIVDDNKDKLIKLGNKDTLKWDKLYRLKY